MKKSRTERKNETFLRDKAISRDILQYGENILQSEAFQNASEETHHLRGSVADHTLTVCILAARICRIMQKHGITVNEKDLIQAALCHDLGMIGRDDLYKSRTDSWQSHPKKSASVARDLVPDLSTNAESMIRTHMWPVSGPHPRSREAVILNAADKWASAADWVYFLTGKQVGAGIRKDLLPKKP